MIRRYTFSGRAKIGIAVKAAEFCLVVATTVLVSFMAGAVVEIKQSVLDELTDLHRVTLSIGGTAAEIRLSAKIAAAASVEQKAYFEGMSTRAQTVLDNSAAATAALTAMIQHTDTQINTVLAPQLAATVKANNERMAQLIADTDQTVKGMAATTTQATVAMANAAKVMGDPAIASTLKHTDATTANLQSMTAHLDNSSALIEKKVRDLTKPASFARAVGTAILDTTYKVVAIFK